jgi:hypothetical protein
MGHFGEEVPAIEHQCLLTWVVVDGGVLENVQNPGIFCKWKFHSQKSITSQAPVAYVCIPSYSGGRDQEDHTLKLAEANSF